MMTHVMLFSSRLRVWYENCPLFYPPSHATSQVDSFDSAD